MSNVGVGGSLELACSKTHEHILRVPHIILILRRRRCRLLFLLLLLLLLTEKVCMSPAFALLLQQTNIRHTSPKARNRRRENTSDEAKLRALDFDQRRCQLRAYPRLRLRLRCCCDCAYAHRRAKKKNHKCSCNVRGNSHSFVFFVLLLSCTLQTRIFSCFFFLPSSSSSSSFFSSSFPSNMLW